jgi:hypothetical protein
MLAADWLGVGSGGGAWPKGGRHRGDISSLPLPRSVATVGWLWEKVWGDNVSGWLGGR